MTRRLWLAVPLAVLLALAGGGAAWAYFTASGSAPVTASADALPKTQGAKPTVSVSGTTATISFTAVTTTGGRGATGYRIRRYDANGTTVQATFSCGTTSCTDSALANGSYRYTYTPLLGTAWLGTESLQSDRAAVGPKQLVFTSAPLSAAATSTADYAVTVQEQDAAGNAVTVPTDLSVALSTTSTKGIFASASKGTATSAVTIPAGASSVTFYYGDTVAGSPTVTAGAAGLANVSQTETINAAAANQFCFVISSGCSNAATVVTSGNGTRSYSTAVGVVDQWGNVTTASTTLTVSVTKTGDGTLPTPASGSVTIPAGQQNSGSNSVVWTTSGSKQLAVVSAKGSLVTATLNLS